MKNLMARLGLASTDDVSTVRSGIAKARSRGDHESADCAEAVLLDPLTRQHYQRVYLHYEAMHAARKCLEHAEAEDTHRWTERLVEFDLPEEPSLEA